jgi:two-component system CheB/CheR fusion protein
VKSQLEHIVVMHKLAEGQKDSQKLSTEQSTIGNGAYALAIHQAIDQGIFMVDLVGRYAKLNVKVVQKENSSKQDIVLMIPTNYSAEIGGTWLIHTDHNYYYSPTPSINLLFEFLAQLWGKRAVAVVLSGTGSLGDRGLRAATANGGIVLWQSPERAQFYAMQRAVIANSETHLVADPATLGNHLNRLSCQRGNEGLIDHGKSISLLLSTGLANVRRSHGIDLARYKGSTLLRQLKRQMSALGYLSIDDCLDLLPRYPNEEKASIGSLLVSVTGIARAPDVYSAITETLGCLMEWLIPGQTMCVWTSSCAMVEQTNSQRITIGQVMDHPGDLSQHLTVFCIDLIDQGLAVARTSETQRADKGPIPYLEEARCFVCDQYQIASQQEIDSSRKILRLEIELYANLVAQHVSIAKLDLRSEELGAGSDELQRAAEKTQTLNEELQASLEELQATIEELTALNQELFVRSENDKTK